MSCHPLRPCPAWVILLSLSAPAVPAEVKLISRNHDPYGCPRPARGQQHVPLRGTFYVELGPGEGGAADPVLPESVAITLQPEGGEAFAILKADRQFQPGY